MTPGRDKHFRCSLARLGVFGAGLTVVSFGLKAIARRLAEKLEIHHTPRHGSWLNMAEIELSVPSRKCLDDYFETSEQMATQIADRERPRNKGKTGINWRFTTADARIRLKRPYPSIQVGRSTSWRRDGRR